MRFLVNTAIAVAGDPVAMAAAFRVGCRSGKETAFLAGIGRTLASAEASQPAHRVFEIVRIRKTAQIGDVWIGLPVRGAGFPACHFGFSCMRGKAFPDRCPNEGLLKIESKLPTVRAGIKGICPKKYSN